MEIVGILFTIVFTVASVIAGYNKRSIMKIVTMETIVTMVVGCINQATELAACDSAAVVLIVVGLFIVVWVLVYIVNKLCWFVGRTIRWMVDGTYVLCINDL